jgi:Tol biopolymer transport system component
MKSLILLAILVLCSCQSLTDDTDLERIVEQDGYYRHPAWSPDGSRLLYLGKPAGELTILYLDDGRKELLPIETGDIAGPITLQWMDDTKIAYTLSYESEKGLQISTVTSYDLNQKQEENLWSGARIYNACWNQAEGMFVFVMRTPIDPYFHVYGNVVRAMDPEFKSFVTLYQVGKDKNIIDIACNRENGVVAVVEREGKPDKDTNRLIIIDVRTKKKQSVFEATKINIEDPTWSPDSQWIALSSESGQADSPIFGLMLISADGTETRTVKEPTYFFSPVEIVWSPIGNNLLVRESSFGDFSLTKLDLTPWLTKVNAND